MTRGTTATLFCIVVLAFCSLALADVYSWRGVDGTGDWMNPAHWSPQGVPGPNDIALVNDAVLQQSCKVFRVKCVLRISRSVVVASFVLNVSALTVEGNNVGSITAALSFRWGNGFFSNVSFTSLGKGAVIGLSQDSDDYSNVSITNKGQFSIVASLTGQPTFINFGKLMISQYTSINGFFNFGSLTIAATPGSRSYQYVEVSGNFVQKGKTAATVVRDGTFAIGFGGFFDGSITVAFNATLGLGSSSYSGPTSTMTPEVSISNKGLILLNKFALQGDLDLSPFGHFNGSYIATNGFTLKMGRLDVTQGSLVGPGALIVNTLNFPHAQLGSSLSKGIKVNVLESASTNVGAFYIQSIDLYDGSSLTIASSANATFNATTFCGGRGNGFNGSITINGLLSVALNLHVRPCSFINNGLVKLDGGISLWGSIHGTFECTAMGSVSLSKATVFNGNAFSVPGKECSVSIYSATFASSAHFIAPFVLGGNLTVLNDVSFDNFGFSSGSINGPALTTINGGSFMDGTQNQIFIGAVDISSEVRLAGAGNVYFIRARRVNFLPVPFTFGANGVLRLTNGAIGQYFGADPSHCTACSVKLDNDATLNFGWNFTDTQWIGDETARVIRIRGPPLVLDGTVGFIRRTHYNSGDFLPASEHVYLETSMHLTSHSTLQMRIFPAQSGQWNMYETNATDMIVVSPANPPVLCLIDGTLSLTFLPKWESRRSNVFSIIAYHAAQPCVGQFASVRYNGLHSTQTVDVQYGAAPVASGATLPPNYLAINIQVCNMINGSKIC